MKKLQHRAFPFELRGGKPDGSYFEGHCAVFNSIDSYGTIMARGCFSRRLPAFMERGFIGGLNHDWDNPIGTPKVAQEDEKGLFVGGDVVDTAHGMDVRKLLAQGVCKRLSFGFDVMGKTFLENAKDVEDYWRAQGYTPTEEDTARCRYGAVVFNDIDVYEFSPVMLPANENAEITGVRAGAAARQTLDDLLHAGAAAVGEVCGCVERYLDMRSKDGRGLQPERHAVIRSMCDRLSAVLAASAPKADPAAVLALRRELILLETTD